MSKNIFRISVISLFIICFCIQYQVLAHEKTDVLHDTLIEEIDSRLASPSQIHVEETDEGVHVSGVLKRRGSYHRKKSLRGHIHVQLINEKNQVIDESIVAVKRKPAAIKHDHYRKFSVILPMPSTKDYTVRVRHEVKTDNHH